MKKTIIKLQPRTFVKMKPWWRLRVIKDRGLSDVRIKEYARKWYEIRHIDRKGNIILREDEMGYRWPLKFFEAVRLEG